MLLTALWLAALAPAPTCAQLDLPRRTIVIRDFARLRQDLLDTLRVNIPDADVQIVQFRGAEVVLAVELLVDEPPEDPSIAEHQLREHCDSLIRRATKGMSLAPSSDIAVLSSPLDPAIPLDPAMDPAAHPEEWSTLPISERIRSIWRQATVRPQRSSDSDSEEARKEDSETDLPADDVATTTPESPELAEGTAGAASSLPPGGPVAEPDASSALPSLQDRLRSLLDQDASDPSPGSSTALPAASPGFAHEVPVPGDASGDEVSGAELYGDSGSDDSPEDPRRPLFQAGFRAYLAHLTGKPVEELEAEREQAFRRLTGSADRASAHRHPRSRRPTPAELARDPAHAAAPRARGTSPRGVARIAPGAAPPSRPAGVETLETLEQSPPVAMRPESGLARVVLAEEQKHRQMLSRLDSSEAISEGTRAAVQDFHESGRILEHDASQDTVRAIYQQIFVERRLHTQKTELERNLHVPPDTTVGPLARATRSRVEDASVRARSPVEPISVSLDDLLTQEIQTLFDSGKPPDIEEEPALE